MRIRQKALALLLAAVLALTALPGAAFAEEDVSALTGEAGAGLEIAETWLCGGSSTNNPDDSVTAVLDSEGTLTVSGNGAMCDYDDDFFYWQAPWKARSGEIKRVVVEDGVTHIGDEAFLACPNLESVQLAGSVRTVGQQGYGKSFADCPRLTRLVILPGDGCEIRDQAFADCPLLTEVSLGEGVASIGFGAFASCSGLKAIQLPESLTTMGACAFEKCSGLTALKLPEKLTSIGQSAFTECAGLTAVELPEGLASIGSMAFYNCAALAAVKFPDSLTSIGSTAFSECAALEEVILPKNLTDLGYSAFYDSGVRRIAVPEGLTIPSEDLPSGAEVRTYTGETPEDFASIPEETPGENPGGGTGENPGGGTGENPGGGTGENPGGGTGENPGGGTGENPGGSTGENPGGSTGENPGGSTGENPGGSTGENPGGGTGENPGGGTPEPPAEIVASGDCGKTAGTVTWSLDENGLLTIQGTGGMKDYSRYSAAPWGAEDVKAVVIEEGVTSAGAYAFYNCQALESVKLPESLTAIGGYAFSSCAALPSVTIPLAVTSLGYSAFSGCGSLTEARVPLGLKKDAQGMFPEACRVTYYGTTGGDCGKTAGTVTWTLDENGLLTIRGTGEMKDYSGRYGAAPWGAEDVKAVVIEEGVTSAGAYAFYNCQALESVKLPESLTAIGNYAFYGCAALPSVTIPQAVASLGYGAFSDCGGLTEAKVPLRLKKSAQGMFPDGCKVTYYGTTGGECGKNGDNVTWTLDGDGLLTIQGTGEMKDYRPHIAESPWSEEAVKAVVVREGVTKVGDLAFGDLTALESAELPEGLTVIGNNAFNGCTALTEITLPRSLERVAGTAFLHSGLTRVRVFYKTVFGSSLFPTDSSAFPGDCLVSLYGKELTPEEPLRATRTAPAGSDNIHAGSGVEYSYLAAGEDGGFYRVNCDSRYNPDKRGYDVELVMEEYGPGGVFYQGWDIPMELDLFGGFYAGEDAFYFVFGRNNTQESDSVEVLRVVKYSKDLERLGAARLMGGNTQYPFDAASCRMAEGNGLLYIHTGHQMYKSNDGYNHQACMTLAVDTSVMEFQYQFYDILNSSVGYVSHSFDQYIRVDGDRVIRLDLGDGYPRGAALFVNGPNLGGDPDYAVTMKWGGDGGDNNTGSRLGGLEVSGSAYLTALSSVDQTGGRQNNNRTYNVYLLATSKGNLKETRTVQVTHFSEGGPRGAGTPKLAKFSDDRFLLLWEEPERVDYSYGSYYSGYTGTVKYAFFDGAGNQLGGVQSMSGALSDCQPEVIDGKAVWYVTEDGGKPVFYQVGSDGTAGSFTPTIGQKPPKPPKPTGESVPLPEEVRKAAADGTAVFAASYSGGKLTECVQGTVKDGKAVFGRKLPASRTLYFLDSDGRPLCPPFAG